MTYLRHGALGDAILQFGNFSRELAFVFAPLVLCASSRVSETAAGGEHARVWRKQ